MTERLRNFKKPASSICFDLPGQVGWHWAFLLTRSWSESPRGSGYLQDFDTEPHSCIVGRHLAFRPHESRVCFLRVALQAGAPVQKQPQQQPWESIRWGHHRCTVCFRRFSYSPGSWQFDRLNKEHAWAKNRRDSFLASDCHKKVCSGSSRPASSPPRAGPQGEACQAGRDCRF